MRRIAFPTLVLFGVVLASCSPSKPESRTADKVAATETPDDDGLVKPEIVRSEQVQIDHGVKQVTVGNPQGHYVLSCNTNLASCVNPMPGADYLLFTKGSRWRFPGAKTAIDLAWLQDWTGTYNNEENIALVPNGGGQPSEFGMYWLRSWSGNKPR